MADGKRPRARRPAGASGAAGDGYHHGDLRAALLAAGEAELAEKGVDGFSLRGCARRAGVSHAAPAHHFKDVRALLTALATLGFRRLAETTEAFGRQAPAGSLDHFTAIGRGYVTFAIENPAYFRLIFRSDSLDRGDPDLIAAGKAAFGVPVAAVGAHCGSADPMEDPELVPLVMGLWSIVQGFSELLLSGQLTRRGTGPDEAMLVEQLLPAILARFVSDMPSTRPQRPESQSPESKSRRARPAAQ